MTFSTPVSRFGFEAQPDLSETDVMDATFYDAAGDDLGGISLDVSGNAGALLFAASSPTANIAKVDLTDLGTTGFGCSSPTGDFAIAEMRFSTAGTPEPASFLLTGVALIGLGAGIRRFRTDA